MGLPLLPPAANSIASYQEIHDHGAGGFVIGDIEAADGAFLFTRSRQDFAHPFSMVPAP
jgi:hypothetical protein